MDINNLLIIDDDDVSVFLVEKIIETEERIKNYTAKLSAATALKHLSSCVVSGNFPDLIIIDLKMPLIDGFEFIERFEKLYSPDFPDTRIMILTNSINSMDKKKSKFYKSIVAYISKPLTKELFTELLEV